MVQGGTPHQASAAEMHHLDSMLPEDSPPMPPTGGPADPGARIAALEAALALTQARLRATFVHNADGVLVVGDGGEVRFANPAAARLFGRDVDALVGAPFGLPIVSEAPAEVELRTAGGRRAVVELHSAPSEWDGQPVHVVTLRDVTDRQLLEEERRLLYDAVQASIDAIAITDATLDGPGPRIRFVNREFLRLTGYELAEVVNQPWSLFVAMPDPGAWLRPLADALSSGQPVEQSAFARRKHGSPVAVDWRVAPARAEPSAITHLVSFQRDASARLEAVEQLRALFEQTGDGILIADSSGYHLDANPAACLLLGRARDQIVGRHIRDLVPGTADIEGRFVDLLRLGALSGTLEIERPDRTPRQVEFAARAHFVPGRHLWVLHDVTERQRLEGELRQVQRMDAVGRLAGGVAHDFNNLLTAVLGYIEVLREEAGHLAAARTPLDAIASAASQASTLTRQLLAFSGRQILRPRAIDLNATLRELLPLVRSVLGEDIEVQYELDPTQPLVKADPGQLEEAVIAVASNARDAMPTGGRLRIETCARLADAEPASAELRFSDTGRGMPPETLEHLFEPFFSTKGLAYGGGLALASVYGFVRQSGGRIHVESSEGRGTTIVIQLPAAARTDAGASPEASAPARGATILVVEDDDGVRELTRRVLAQVGHRVLAAASGAEALALIRTTEIDLVLTDVVMPGMNGRELVERIKPTHPHTRVIFSSGYTEAAVLQRGVTSRDVAFLEKPYSPAQLRQAVQQALAQPPRS